MVARVEHSGMEFVKTFCAYCFRGPICKCGRCFSFHISLNSADSLYSDLNLTHLLFAICADFSWRIWFVLILLLSFIHFVPSPFPRAWYTLFPWKAMLCYLPFVIHEAWRTAIYNNTLGTRMRQMIPAGQCSVFLGRRSKSTRWNWTRPISYLFPFPRYALVPPYHRLYCALSYFTYFMPLFLSSVQWHWAWGVCGSICWGPLKEWRNEGWDWGGAGGTSWITGS